MANHPNKGGVPTQTRAEGGARAASVARFVAVAVGGSNRDRVSRAALAGRVTKLHSLAVRTVRPPWSKVSPLPCHAPEAPGIAVDFLMVPADHMILLGHMPPADFDEWCGITKPSTVTIAGPGFNYTKTNGLPEGVLTVTADSVPSYTKRQWQALVEHYPATLKAMRSTLVGSFFCTRSAEFVKGDGTDAFYRWAGIAPKSGPEFEAAVVEALREVCPRLNVPASGHDPVVWLQLTLDGYEKAGLARCPLKNVTPAVLAAVDRYGTTSKEYDAFVLHHALRGIAGLSGLLTHDFHYQVLMAVLKDDPCYDQYLRKLVPTGTVNVVHDLGLDPNCDDYLALRLAERVASLSS